MKKITLLALATLFTFQIKAQLEPDLQKFFRTIWNPIAAHDSIVLLTDSTATASIDGIAAMTLFPDNNFSAISYYDSAPSLVAVGQGTQTGNTTEILGFDDPATLVDTSTKYIFIKNQAGKDSLLSLYTNDNGNWLAEQAIEIVYKAGSNEIDKMIINVDIVGAGNLSPIFEYNFFYNNGRLDSIGTTGLLFNMSGKGRHHYDANGKLLYFQMDPQFFGEDTPFRYDFEHNAQNEIIAVTESEQDTLSGQWSVVSHWKYLVKPNSNISVKEPNTVKVGLYPNPSTDFLNVQTVQNFESYEILNLTGKVLESGKMKKRIQTKHLHRGVYFLRLKQGDSTTLKKFHKL